MVNKMPKKATNKQPPTEGNGGTTPPKPTCIENREGKNVEAQV
jgi:hypothetical protein